MSDGAVQEERRMVQQQGRAIVEAAVQDARTDSRLGDGTGFRFMQAMYSAGLFGEEAWRLYQHTYRQAFGAQGDGAAAT